MPFLDVSDILFDPDFCEMLTVTRRTQTGMSDGQPVFSTATLAVTGSVQPAKSADLQRMLDAGCERGGVTVYAYGANALQSGDEFAWQGDTYTVMGADDWSKFGAGYVKADAGKTNLP